MRRFFTNEVGRESSPWSKAEAIALARYAGQEIECFQIRTKIEVFNADGEHVATAIAYDFDACCNDDGLTEEQWDEIISSAKWLHGTKSAKFAIEGCTLNNGLQLVKHEILKWEEGRS